MTSDPNQKQETVIIMIFKFNACLLYITRLGISVNVLAYDVVNERRNACC
jgi:hypothetical protein